MSKSKYLGFEIAMGVNLTPMGTDNTFSAHTVGANTQGSCATKIVRQHPSGTHYSYYHGPMASYSFLLW